MKSNTLVLKLSKAELRDRFLSLRSGEDLAALLDVPYSNLIYHLYKVPDDQKYAVHEIPKRNGGTRKIHEPATALKIIQRKLNQILQAVYDPRECVHGFVQGKSIVTNARAHSDQRWVLNVDLRTFFPSINSGRVRGLFLASPFRFRKDVATLLAQTACHRNILPQGAPTSPVISNMVCVRLDRELQALAKEHDCFYTRYADDLTFSCGKKDFPSVLASRSAVCTEVGATLRGCIASNGFSINPTKSRLQHRSVHQDVTGLTVNRFPNVSRKYVRQIRAMLHAWETYGYEAAERHYREEVDPKSRAQLGVELSFQAVVRGKLEFLRHVKGTDDLVYSRYAAKFNALVGREALSVGGVPGQEAGVPLVVTEGKTDWMHLESALERLQATGLFAGLTISFHKDEEDMGDRTLLSACRTRSRFGSGVDPFIAVFDSDNEDIVPKVSGKVQTYKSWGKNVFSFPLPVPHHRSTEDGVCIELYYKDADLERETGDGRRLFLNREFDRKTGFHVHDCDLYCENKKARTQEKLAPVDGGVQARDVGIVSLSKTEFANLVYKGEVPADSYDYSVFIPVFTVLEEILAAARGAVPRRQGTGAN